jgi:hypothetical protein
MYLLFYGLFERAVYVFLGPVSAFLRRSIRDLVRITLPGVIQVAPAEVGIHASFAIAGHG